MVVKRVKSWLVGLLPLFVIIVVWQFTVVAFDLPSYLLPLPAAVLVDIMSPRIPWLVHIYTTTYEVLLGFLLACVVGIAGAVGSSLSRRFGEVIYPYLVVAQVAPKIAIAPLLLIWLGYGLTPKILLVFLISFFPIFLDTLVGLESITTEHLDLGDSLHATRWQMLRHVELPNALPLMFNGMKVGVTLAVVGAIVGEFVASTSGLGYLLILSGATADTALTFAALIIVSGLGLLLYVAIGIIERLLLPWVHLAKRERLEGTL